MKTIHENEPQNSEFNLFSIKNIQPEHSDLKCNI